MTYATNGLKMPTNYVDMSESEMEFDGSWSWGKFWAGVAIAGLALAVVGGIGMFAAAAVSITAASIFGTGVAMAVVGDIAMQIGGY